MKTSLVFVVFSLRKSYQTLPLCQSYPKGQSPNMGVPTFSSTENALTFIIKDCVLRFRSKKVLFYLNFTFR